MPRLKIKPEHIQALRAAMGVFLTDATAEIYKGAGLPVKRHLWDALWSACKHNPGLNDVVREVYTYANDDNLYAVFKLLRKEKHDEAKSTCG